jgi:hypothetical protein
MMTLQHESHHEQGEPIPYCGACQGKLAGAARSVLILEAARREASVATLRLNRFVFAATWALTVLSGEQFIQG